MHDETVIEIIMGTYNGERFLQDQLYSLLGQTYTRWRLLVRDDGSTDTTINLLKSIALTDSRVCIITDDLGNLGFSQNFFLLLKQTTASYVMFCDQDDIWLPQKIEATLREMIRIGVQHPGKPTLVHCDATVVDSNLAMLRKRFVRTRARRPGLSGMLFANSVQGAASMINAQLRDRVLRVPLLLPYDFHCGLIAAAVGHRHFIDEALLLYRQHSDNTIGVGKPNNRIPNSRISPTLRLAIKASTPVRETVGFLGEEVSPSAAKEIRDFAELLSSKSIVKRLFLAIRRRYGFYRRRDQLNLLLYICNLPNI
jgi:glycosyltransferase involved in cell wall biosynthesis